MSVSPPCPDELDDKDPLRSLRGRFTLPDGVIYLDGNSLGPVPSGVPEALADAVHEQWGKQLVRSWIDWMRRPLGLGDRIGRMVGAAPGNIVVGDSTSVQLFNTLVAAARLRPERRLLVTDADHFPTDLHLADSAARLLGLRSERVPMSELADFLHTHGDEVAVVSCPVVDYRTGELWDLPSLTAAAHDVGAVTLWDLCHAAGAMPLGLDMIGVDFAVGCTYKYLSGGPGSPAFVYVHPRHQEAYDQPLTGWLGHADPFATDGRYRPAPGVNRAVIGTPPMLSALALEAALDAYDGVTMSQVRDKSLSLTGYFIQCADSVLAPYGFSLVTPRDDARRGSHVALRHAEAYPLVQALMRRGVIADVREPDLLRFGFHPLYVSHRDVRDAVEHLRAVVEAGEQHNPDFVRRSAFG